LYTLIYVYNDVGYVTIIILILAWSMRPVEIFTWTK
jgi:hypothetical protein